MQQEPEKAEVRLQCVFVFHIVMSATSANNSVAANWVTVNTSFDACTTKDFVCFNNSANWTLPTLYACPNKSLNQLSQFYIGRQWKTWSLELQNAPLLWLTLSFALWQGCCWPILRRPGYAVQGTQRLVEDIPQLSQFPGSHLHLPSHAVGYSGGHKFQPYTGQTSQDWKNNERRNLGPTEEVVAMQIWNPCLCSWIGLPVQDFDFEPHRIELVLNLFVHNRCVHKPYWHVWRLLYKDKWLPLT